MVILDSDILVGLLRNNPDASKKIQQFLEKEETLSTTTISSYELLRGALLSAKKKENVQEVYALLQTLTLYTFDFSSSLICSQVSCDLRNLGRETSLPDLMIASIALSKKEKIVTRNAKDFGNIVQLKIEEW